LIAAAYEENRRSIRAIARDFNVSQAAIRKKARKLGLVRSSQKDEFARTTAAVSSLVVGLRAIGTADGVIAETLIAQAAALQSASVDARTRSH
jgi:transposase-like protein